VVYHLRTALDHLLSALVLVNGGTPTEAHQFPICSTPEKFIETVNRGRIKGVSPTAEKLIELIQPYQSTQPPMLTFMRDWNNTDKHRLLIVVGGAAALGQKVTLKESDGDLSITGMSPPFVKRVTNDGKDIFTICFGEPHAKFEADAEFVPHVAIENVGTLECATVSEVLIKMVGFTRYVLDAFAGEFK
jgi:hypothetical protein